MPAPLAAQSTGAPGGDGAAGTVTEPFPGPHGVNIIGNVETTHGRVLGGQDDVPSDEQLREADIIKFSATASGSGGGPMSNGGTCAPSQADLAWQLPLPAIALHMDPPAPSSGGLGGVVTVPTFFWAQFLGDATPTFHDQRDYQSCDPHTDQVTQETFWSPSTHTLTMDASAVPVGYAWSFGDRDVIAACPDRTGVNTTGMGVAPFPPINHAYCVSSKRTIHTDGYPVIFKATFHTVALVNGLPLMDGPTSSANIGRFPVREVQSVLDG